MKTTLELPDALYRKVKTMAATENKKIRDLVSEGLELLMETQKNLPTSSHSTNPSHDQDQVLQALRKIKQCPPSQSISTQELIHQANLQRKSGWNREDL